MSRNYNATRRQHKHGSDPFSLLTRSVGPMIEPELPEHLPPPHGELVAAEPMPATAPVQPAPAAPDQEPEAAPDPPLCDVCLECASESGAPFVTEEAA